ncbi:MAG: chemotaxis protein CheX [Clostridiales bacterium]|nr:chemotaxis protein CheX [Clostridiales bacterium]
MFGELFGAYLVDNGKLNRDQFVQVKNTMKSARVKLGLIAVAEKLLTISQADEVNRIQAREDKRFGDIAVEKGYLTDTQVGHLLSLQGNPYLQFIQAVTEKDFMTIDEVETALKEYQALNGFTDSEIADIKTGDVDKISSLFIKTDNPLADELMALAVRNVVRFISTEVSISKSTSTPSLNFEHLATQKVYGDHNILLGFSGDDTSLLSIANPFAKEEFTAIDEDSFDSVCEFINCINGLFATKLSNEDVNIDMEPPVFFNNGSISSDLVYVLPLTIAGANTNLIVCIDSDLCIK